MRNTLNYFHCCPEKILRFLPTVEMTRNSWVFQGVGNGGGEAATIPHPIRPELAVIPNITKWSEESECK